VVHDAARARVATSLCLAAALAASGCTGGGSGGAAPEPNAGARIGQPTRLVACGDWNEAGVRERYGTIEALSAFAGGQTGTPPGHGATLDHDAAYELFERYCSNEFARGFRLYKLYTRAAAFTRR
jgi:hypothetical protein